MGKDKGVESDGQPGDDSPPVGPDSGVDPLVVADHWEWKFTTKPPERKLILMITDREFNRRVEANLGIKDILRGHCADVTIASTPDDDPDFPIYGKYYYRLLNPERDQHVTPRTDISRRILHEDNRHKLLALKANLIEELEL